MKTRMFFSYFVAAALGAVAYAQHATVLDWVRGAPALAAQSASQNPAQQSATSPERRVLYWVDPMHPSYKSDKPGTAPDCGMDLVPVYADQQSAGDTFPPGTVRISPQKLQLIGVTYGEVAAQPLARTLRAVGRVTYDETRIARIHPKVDGWIEQVFVDFTGKQVEKGQPLLSVYSPELLATQQEFLIARRAKDSLAAAPMKEIASSTASLYQSARDRLRLWDVTDEQIQQLEQRGEASRTLTIFSPIGGVVVTRNAFPTQRLTPEMELYTIADLSTVWVLADIYESELPMIQVGQTATMTLAYLPGKTFAGKVSFINPQVDNMTRTVKARLEFPNPNLELKPEMFANVELKMDYGRQVFVPEEAVLDSGSEQIVFIAHEGGYFEPRQVQLGARVDGRQIVLAGLKPGERIVTSGNFLIDSESRLKSALSGLALGHEHAAAEPRKPAPKPAAPAEDHSQHSLPALPKAEKPAAPPHKH